MKKPQILIVEDANIVAMHIQKVLHHRGYEVAGTVSSGEESLSMVERLQPDLVLMDIQLTGRMDGVEAAEEIRRRHGIPVIYLTAYADRATLERAKVTEPFGYIVKPFEERDLQIAIEMALYKHQMEEQLRASEKKYRMLVENIGEIVYLVQGGEVTSSKVELVSGQVEDLLGYRPQEFSEDPALWFRIIHPDDRPAVIDATQQIYARGTQDIRVYRVRHKHTGEYRWLEDKVVPQLDEDGHVVGHFGLAGDITERRLAEAEIRKLSNAVEQVADAIVVTDREGTIEYVNQAFEETTGYSRADALGRTPAILRSGVHEQAFYQRLWQTILSGETFRAVFTNRRKDGTIYYADRTISPLKDGRGRITHFVSTGRDITERKELEKRLQAVYRLGQKLTLLRDEAAIASQVMEAAVDAFHLQYIGCGLVDEAQGELVYRYQMSRGLELELVETRLSLDGEESIGPAVVRDGKAIYIPDISREKHLSAVANTSKSGSELCVPMKIGTKVTGVLDVHSRAPNSFSVVDQQLLQTLADQAAVALENARLYRIKQDQYRRLRESQAQLVQAEKMGAIGRLAASIAHEINNPLQSVQGCLTLTREQLAGPQQREKVEQYLDIVEGEIDRIAAIVRRMRDFYRPAQEEFRTIDVHDVLKAVLRLSNKQMEHNRVALKCHWATDPPPVEANPDHLKQVFLNLILNAIDAMPNGGALTIRTATDEIDVEQNGQRRPAMRIEFRDTGEGIPPDALDRLFEPFFTTKAHGSGLGLSITYSIIQSHQGQITATSEEGKGTTFTILLPVQQQAEK